MNTRQRITVDRPPRMVPTLALKAGSCADALDVSLQTFLTLVKEGKMPGPIAIPGHGGLALYDFEAVRNAWTGLVEAAGGSNADWQD